MDRKFRFHVLSSPNTRTSPAYSYCAFTLKAYKFCKMMHERGHYVIHYGVEGGTPECDENVSVVTNELFDEYTKDYDYKTKYIYHLGEANYFDVFNANAVKAILERIQPYDFVLAFAGEVNKYICEAILDSNPNAIIVEPGIGYAGGSFAKYKVFESYGIYHCYLGIDAVSVGSINNYWTIIPNYFDLSNFTYNPVNRGTMKNKYLLCISRVDDCKGINIAINMSQELGIKLKIAGLLGSDNYRIMNENNQWPANVEYVGVVDFNQRNELMSNATALFLASQYAEPFGGTAVEAMICGTPIITSDWGVFPEYNIQGVTGYRCKTYDDYINAVLDCANGKIRPIDCRIQGEKYSLENIALKYEKYFNDLYILYTTKEGILKLSDETRFKIHEYKRNND